MRILGKNKLYLKNTSVVERMSRVNTVVFDKTGTITSPGDSDITFSGNVLTAYEQKLVKSLVRNSLHPLSSKIYAVVEGDDLFEVDDYKESLSKGIEGNVDGKIIKLGSLSFVESKDSADSAGNNNHLNTRVYLSINNILKGYFTLSNIYRQGLEEVTSELGKDFSLSVLSGDNEGEKQNILRFFDKETDLKFNQSPENKLEFIESLQRKGKNVMMLGDGLNDAGALKQSDVGIAVAEDITGFSPACDGILDASVFGRISKFIRYAVSTKRVIIASFIISFLYNIAGITLAFQGMVSPLLAAVLMPASSVSVVLFTVIFTNITAKRSKLL
jgi:Cu+-exporting ATPase